MSELIKREDVQREIQASFDGGAFRWQDGQDLMDRINALPTIDAVPVRHGEWIYHNYEDGNWYCTCSNCGKGDLHAIKGTVPYCWNCGARMDGGKHDLR